MLYGREDGHEPDAPDIRRRGAAPGSRCDEREPRPRRRARAEADDADRRGSRQGRSRRVAALHDERRDPGLSRLPRSFTGVSLGKARLFTLQDTAVVGKSPSAAAKLISSILLASSSKSGRDALYVESEKSFASSSHLTVRSGAVTRAGELAAGDGAAEIVFRFDTAKGSFQVGEIFVRVGGNLSAIYYGAGMPGVSQASARRLALAAARHMQVPA